MPVTAPPQTSYSKRLRRHLRPATTPTQVTVHLRHETNPPLTPIPGCGGCWTDRIDVRTPKGVPLGEVRGLVPDTACPPGVHTARDLGYRAYPASGPARRDYWAPSLTGAIRLLLDVHDKRVGK